MPTLFVGHGSPMNAIEDNAFTRGWEAVAEKIPKPTAIVCVSAHWYTRGTKVTAMDQPKTIHDFGGFPRELYQVKYPAPGNPDLAKQTQTELTRTDVCADLEWGLDHGSWSVLCKMYPEANIPVIQLSIDDQKNPQGHYEIGQDLRKLREQGVLIVGSGNIVHHLGLVDFEHPDAGFDWAQDFDQFAKHAIENRNDDRLIHFEKAGHGAELAIPTPDHYLPLLYVLGASDAKEKVGFFNEALCYGSLSMRGVIVG